VLDLAWDMWEQHSAIVNNMYTGAEQVIAIKVQLQLLYRKGKNAFLSQDRLLFSKREKQSCSRDHRSKCYNGLHQLNATRQTAMAKHDLEASMQSEQGLMKCWMQRD
jgi:hypothetical protein